MSENVGYAPPTPEQRKKHQENVAIRDQKQGSALRTLAWAACPLANVRAYAALVGIDYPPHDPSQVIAKEFLDFLKEFFEHIAENRTKRSTLGVTTLSGGTLETYYFAVVRDLRTTVPCLNDRYWKDKAKIHCVLRNFRKRALTDKTYKPKRFLKRQWWPLEHELARQVCNDMLDSEPAKALQYGAVIAVGAQHGQRPGQMAKDQVGSC
jgi:hypothetical protein